MVFGENGVSTKALVAVLSYFILSAKGKSPSLEQRLCGLEAASLYLLLLKIPGQYPHLKHCSKTAVYQIRSDPSAIIIINIILLLYFIEITRIKMPKYLQKFSDFF